MNGLSCSVGRIPAFGIWAPASLPVTLVGSWKPNGWDTSETAQGSGKEVVLCSRHQSSQHVKELHSEPCVSHYVYVLGQETTLATKRVYVFENVQFVLHPSYVLFRVVLREKI